MSSTKDIILNCARDQFLSDGYKGLSMRRIAAKADISATAIYRHFSNKEELFHCVLEKGFNTYTRYLTPALDASTAKERFRKTLAYTLAFVLEHPRYFELIFVRSDTKDQLVHHDELRTRSKMSFDFYTARIRECMDEGYLKQDNPSELSVLLLATFTGFFSLYTSGVLPRSQGEIEALFWRTTERILAGIAA